MTSATEVEKQLTKLLDDAAQKLNLEKYSFNLDLNVLKGDGFLGEFYKASLTDQSNHTTTYLATKLAPKEEYRREQNSIESAYKNEIFFYSKIVPSFKRLEEEHQVQEPFCAIPGYITCEKEIRKEAIVFKDITKEGYILREKDLLLDDEHASLIFKTYGHFHAISFCMKQLNPEEFERLTKPLKAIWVEMGHREAVRTIFTDILNEAYSTLDPDTEGHIREKFFKYTTNAPDLFLEAADYKGQYFGIVHGDCWSNNMMFKYQDNQNCSNLESMKLLDFQLVIASTPIHDLSYFFYTGGSKELFDKLEHYLDIYHESFSSACRNLGCNPDELFPRDVLTQEWKKYSKFGMILGALLTRIKLISKEAAIEMINHADSMKKDDIAESDRGNFMNIKVNEELFRKRVYDIVVHMYEIDAL